MLNTSSLKTENLQRFVGGAAKITHEYEVYQYRGTIAQVCVEGGTLKVIFSSVEQLKGKPGEARLSYELSLQDVAYLDFQRDKLVMSIIPHGWDVVELTCSKEMAATAPPLPKDPAIHPRVVQGFVGGNKENGCNLLLEEALV